MDPDLSDAEVRTHARDFKLTFRIARDRRGAFARKIGATMTPEAFVLDRSGGKVRYHGRIDDQFVARRVRNATPERQRAEGRDRGRPAGKEVAAPHVEAVGCPIPEAPAAVARPTYTKDVAPILQKNCQECHRPGQVGPFSLETYEQARKRAADIATVVEDRAMPPWKASPALRGQVQGRADPLRRRTSPPSSPGPRPAPRKAIRRDLPPRPEVRRRLELGTPDLVVDIGADFADPGLGRRHLSMLRRPDRAWTRISTSRRSSTGSAIAGSSTTSWPTWTSRARRGSATRPIPGPGYSCFAGPGEPIHGDLGGWAPGIQPSPLPDGIGRSLPRGADIIVQVHYHPSGKAETDRTRIGLHFARKPIRQTLHWTRRRQPRDGAAARATRTSRSRPPGRSRSTSSPMP